MKNCTYYDVSQLTFKHADKCIFLLFSNIDKIKMEAVWNDDVQRWKVPDLVVEKTKLPPAGK